MEQNKDCSQRVTELDLGLREKNRCTLCSAEGEVKDKCVVEEENGCRLCITRKTKRQEEATSDENLKHSYLPT